MPFLYPGERIDLFLSSYNQDTQEIPLAPFQVFLKSMISDRLFWSWLKHHDSDCILQKIEIVLLKILENILTDHQSFVTGTLPSILAFLKQHCKLKKEPEFRLTDVLSNGLYMQSQSHISLSECLFFLNFYEYSNDICTQEEKNCLKKHENSIRNQTCDLSADVRILLKMVFKIFVSVFEEINRSDDTSLFFLEQSQSQFLSFVFAYEYDDEKKRYTLSENAFLFLQYVYQDPSLDPSKLEDFIKIMEKIDIHLISAIDLYQSICGGWAHLQRLYIQCKADLRYSKQNQKIETWMRENTKVFDRISQFSIADSLCAVSSSEQATIIWFKQQKFSCDMHITYLQRIFKDSIKHSRYAVCKYLVLEYGFLDKPNFLHQEWLTELFLIYPSLFNNYLDTFRSVAEHESWNTLPYFIKMFLYNESKSTIETLTRTSIAIIQKINISTWVDIISDIAHHRGMTSWSIFKELLYPKILKIWEEADVEEVKNLNDLIQSIENNQPNIEFAKKKSERDSWLFKRFQIGMLIIMTEISCFHKYDQKFINKVLKDMSKTKSCSMVLSQETQQFENFFSLLERHFFYTNDPVTLGGVTNLFLKSKASVRFLEKRFLNLCRVSVNKNFSSTQDTQDYLEKIFFVLNLYLSMLFVISSEWVFRDKIKNLYLEMSSCLNALTTDKNIFLEQNSSWILQILTKTYEINVPVYLDCINTNEAVPALQYYLLCEQDSPLLLCEDDDTLSICEHRIPEKNIFELPFLPVLANRRWFMLDLALKTFDNIQDEICKHIMDHHNQFIKHYESYLKKECVLDKTLNMIHARIAGFFEKKQLSECVLDDPCSSNKKTVLFSDFSKRKKIVTIANENIIHHVDNISDFYKTDENNSTDIENDKIATKINITL